MGARRDVGALPAAADAFFPVSAQEGLPNVLLEAQWAALPCLTIAGGGAAEAICCDGAQGRI